MLGKSLSLSFFIGSLAVLAQFVEKMILFLLNCLSNFFQKVIDHNYKGLFLDSQVYSMMYISIFIHIIKAPKRVECHQFGEKLTKGLIRELLALIFCNLMIRVIQTQRTIFFLFRMFNRTWTSSEDIWRDNFSWSCYSTKENKGKLLTELVEIEFKTIVFIHGDFRHSLI